ncbi:hypothetical protein JXR93_00765 [bacterium]|nr:hypothetical protein [bacterium]
MLKTKSILPIFIIIILSIFLPSCKKKSKESNGLAFIKSEISFTKEEMTHIFLEIAPLIDDQYVEMFKSLELENLKNISFVISDEKKFIVKVDGINIFKALEYIDNKEIKDKLTIKKTERFRYIENENISLIEKDKQYYLSNMDKNSVFDGVNFKEQDELKKEIESLKHNGGYISIYDEMLFRKGENLPFPIRSINKISFYNRKEGDKLFLTIKISPLKEKYVDYVVEYLTNLHKNQYPILLESIKLDKDKILSDNSLGQKKEIREMMYNMIFGLFKDIGDNLKIESKKTYVEISLPIDGIINEIVLIPIIAAIAVPAYQSYAKASQNNK